MCKIDLDSKYTEYSTPRELADELVSSGVNKRYGASILNQGWATEDQCSAMCYMLNNRKSYDSKYNLCEFGVDIDNNPEGDTFYGQFDGELCGC